MINSNPTLVINKKEKPYEVYRFNEVYDLLFEDIAIFGLSIINNTEEVEDTIHEIFIKLLNKKQIFVSFAALKSYLFVSIKNHLLNKIKSKTVTNKYIERTKYSSTHYSESIDDSIVQSEIYKEVLKIYQKLPSKCKEVFDLHLAGLSVKQIAEKLNISVNTVKLHKKNALKKLRTDISPDIFMMMISFI